MKLPSNIDHKVQAINIKTLRLSGNVASVKNRCKILQLDMDKLILILPYLTDDARTRATNTLQNLSAQIQELKEAAE